MFRNNITVLSVYHHFFASPMFCCNDGFSDSTSLHQRAVKSFGVIRWNADDVARSTVEIKHVCRYAHIFNISIFNILFHLFFANSFWVCEIVFSNNMELNVRIFFANELCCFHKLSIPFLFNQAGYKEECDRLRFVVKVFIVIEVYSFSSFQPNNFFIIAKFQLFDCLNILLIQ